MADVTIANSPALTGTTKDVQAVHEGVNVVPFSWSAAGTTISASQLLFLAKIPAGAIITRFSAAGWIGCAGTCGVDVGLAGQASADFIVDGTDISATATANMVVRAGALPLTCSMSDDTSPRFRYLQAKFVSAATATTTAIFNGVVEYVMGKPAVASY